MRELLLRDYDFIKLPTERTRIAGEKPTRIAPKEWEYPHGYCAGKMILNDGVGERQIFARLTFAKAPRVFACKTKKRRLQLNLGK